MVQDKQRAALFSGESKRAQRGFEIPVGLLDTKSPTLTNIVVGVDDTDDLSKKISTGAIAQSIAEAAQALGGELKLGITRHQLLISDEVPYTSHNSAMVFEATIPSDRLILFSKKAESIIAEFKASTSDPGLCIANLSFGSQQPDYYQELEALVNFGCQAKIRFCTVKEAYELAQSLSWLNLKSCGGDESGVVGSLAGVGLRLSGNDGHFRGRYDLSFLKDTDEPLTVGLALSALEDLVAGSVAVLDINGFPLDSAMPISDIEEVKPVFYGSTITLVCVVKEGKATPCSKKDLERLANEKSALLGLCDEFEWDNDIEECVGEKKSCCNCLYRRWIAGGFKCVK